MVSWVGKKFLRERGLWKSIAVLDNSLLLGFGGVDRDISLIFFRSYMSYRSRNGNGWRLDIIKQLSILLLLVKRQSALMKIVSLSTPQLIFLIFYCVAVRSTFPASLRMPRRLRARACRRSSSFQVCLFASSTILPLTSGFIFYSAIVGIFFCEYELKGNVNHVKVFFLEFLQ